MIGVHLPGRSPVHRLPAGPKLLLLIVAIVGITVLRQPWQLGLAALLVLGVVALSRLPWRAVVEQVWSLRWLLLVLAVVQVLVAGWSPALMLVGGLVLAITLAAVVTLTTSVTAILDLTRKVAGPLRRFGVDPDRIGLVLALTIRAIPLLTGIVREVAEARAARNLGFSLRAFAAPIVVRALRTADGIGESLVARGVDD